MKLLKWTMGFEVIDLANFMLDGGGMLKSGTYSTLAINADCAATACVIDCADEYVYQEAVVVSVWLIGDPELPLSGGEQN